MRALLGASGGVRSFLSARAYDLCIGNEILNQELFIGSSIMISYYLIKYIIIQILIKKLLNMNFFEKTSGQLVRGENVLVRCRAPLSIQCMVRRLKTQKNKGFSRG